MNNLFSKSIIAVVMILAFVSFTNSQVVKLKDSTSGTKTNWIFFSPPDKSFTIELPKFPKYERKIAGKSIRGEIDSNLLLFKCTKSVSAFYLPSLVNKKLRRLELAVFDVSGCNRDESDFDKEIRTYFLIIGGDQKEIISDKKVELNGLNGREITYKNRSKRFTRIVVINGDKRIFLLSYYRSQGKIEEEERIFQTFKPKIKK